MEKLNIDHYRFKGEPSSSSLGGELFIVTVYPDKTPKLEFWNPNPYFPRAHDIDYYKEQPFAPFYGTTISELFVELENDIKRQYSSNGFDFRRIGVTIEYDEQYHFPKYFSIWRKGNQDPGYGASMRISDFEDLRKKYFSKTRQIFRVL